ncbi:MAG: hypothetical protein OWU32_11450 [Firmicutes bacterium]|nr:hypothetical protein [Bacillota bacterium]
MTKRYSVADVAQMLQVDSDLVRGALDHLSATGALTAESFLFADRAWRVAPSDVTKIQLHLQARPKAMNGELTPEKRRRVIRKEAAPPE